jgi:hypothetical protein
MMRRKVFSRTVLAQPAKIQNREENVTKAGASAFGIRIPFYNCPFNNQPQRSWWIRGFKRAEREFFEREQRSQRVQETIDFEMVEA